MLFVVAALGCTAPTAPQRAREIDVPPPRASGARIALATQSSAAEPARSPARAAEEAAEPAPAPSCAEDAGRPSADAATKALIAELAAMQQQTANERAVEVQTPRYDIRVSAKIRTLFPRMKRVARQIIPRLLAALPNRFAACDRALGGALASELTADGVRIGENSGGVGALDRLEIAAQGDSPRRWVVVASLTLPCGNDGSVYVLEEKASGPTLVLAVETNGYWSIRDGQLGAIGKLSPPDPQGHYFLVTAEATPWCSSTWSGLRYRAFEPGAAPDAAKLLLDEHSSVHYGDGDVADIRPSADGFGIHFEAWDEIGGGIMRAHVRNYRRSGAHFERIQPFAERVQDVPDEWLQLPWPHAMKLCVPGKQVALKASYEQLHAAMLTDRAAFETETDAGPGRRHVTFKCENCQKFPAHVSFDLIADQGGYLIESVTTKP